MSFPTIDVTALPDLPEATGVFGSQGGEPEYGGWNDAVVIIAVYMYEIMAD